MAMALAGLYGAAEYLDLAIFFFIFGRQIVKTLVAKTIYIWRPSFFCHQIVDTLVKRFGNIVEM